jgi:hypothetical protein
MAGQVCIGPEFGTDSSTPPRLTARSPRPANAPTTLPAGTGLLLDAGPDDTPPGGNGGLWVAQTPKWMFQQRFGASPGWGNQVGLAAGGYRDDYGGAAWQVQPITVAPITNPSGVQQMVCTLEVEWEVHAYVGQSAWLEVWGSCSFPGDAAQPVSIANGARMGTFPAAPSWWHQATKRTVQFTIGPGQTSQPTMTWAFTTVWIDGTTAPNNPTLYSWAAAVSGMGYLTYPGFPGSVN